MSSETSSNLLHYLNQYHSALDIDSLRHDFREKFGVDVKSEDNLFLFKYNMLDAQWSRNITWECRGSILRYTNGHWEFVCRPFNKFFNQHETKCPIHDEQLFNSQCAQLSMVEKADGTCITLWFDSNQDSWRVSTLGTITPMNVGDFPITFTDLFWETLGVNSHQIYPFLDKENTYIFELCCEENRILTKYEQPSIFILGIRNKNYGTYSDTFVQQSLCETLAEEISANIKMPYRELFTRNDIHSLQDAKKFVEDMSEETDLFGEYPEGFIIYDGFKPIAKMKNALYVSLHHVAGGDIAHTRNVIIDAFFQGHLDDIYDHLTDRMKEFADGLKVKVHKLFTSIEQNEKHFVNKTFETQKEYALTVQEYVEKPFWAFFFQNKTKIENNENEFMELFTKWVRENYKKFIDHWKS